MTDTPHDNNNGDNFNPILDFNLGLGGLFQLLINDGKQDIITENTKEIKEIKEKYKSFI